MKKKKNQKISFLTAFVRKLHFLNLNEQQPYYGVSAFRNIMYVYLCQCFKSQT